MKKTNRYKVVLIERHDLFRDSLAELLVVKDFQVLKADNAYWGLKLAKEQAPDLIICARSFPDACCLNVLHELRKEESTRGIPFIFLSSKPAGYQHELMNREETVISIIKPFCIEELIEHIEQCLALPVALPIRDIEERCITFA